MRKVIAGLFISLDGVVESPQNWHFPYFNDEMGQAVGSQIAATDAMLLGRVTYQEFAAFWRLSPAKQKSRTAIAVRLFQILASP